MCRSAFCDLVIFFVDRHGFLKNMKLNQQKSIDRDGNHNGNASTDEEDYYISIDELIEDDLYILRQRRAYFSIAFSVVQTCVLIAMMAKCGVAPFRINPMLGPYPDGLDYWGAKNAYKILNDHERWRLVSPILLHGGVVHLLSNIAVQLDTCALWEKEWGSGCWLAIYLASGLGSSMMSVMFKPNSVSVGSSGAVMGLFGGKIAEIICRCRESSKSIQGQVGRKVRCHQLTSVLCTVVLVGAFSFVPYVDWAAHLGGFISGFCVGIFIFSFWIKSRVWFVLCCCLGLVLTILYYTLGSQYLADVHPDEQLEDVCEYYQQYFEDYQCHCRLLNKNDG